MPSIKLAAFFILIVGFEFVHFYPQLINKLSISLIWPLIWSTHFWVIPRFTFFLSSKNKKKYYQKNITVKRGCQNAQKMVKNWLIRFKNTKIEI
jgi:hypothetical protein